MFDGVVNFVKSINMAVVIHLYWALVVLHTLCAHQNEAFQLVDVKVTFDSNNSPDFKVLLNKVECL